MRESPADLSSVIESGMCIGCGACVAANPELDLVLDPERLIWQPDSAGGAREAAVCPAIQVDFPGLQEWLFPDQTPGDYGIVERVFLAQSTNLDRNLAASSGGTIKELLLKLMELPDVSGVIALDRVEGLDYRPRLVTDPSEIDRLPGSIYHHIRFDHTLKILREHPGKVVLAAIPCQLEGIFQYIRAYEPELLDRIHTTIGLLCGWLYSWHALKAICAFKGLDSDHIEDVSYRGGGPVGRLRIRAGGKEALVSRRIDFDYQVAFDRSFNAARCHVCINHSNFLADIVVGDAWLPSTVTTRTGVSLVICRKKGSSQILSDLVEAQRLVVTECTTAEILESQTSRVVFGDFAYPYAEYLKEIGLRPPDMIGPNRSRARAVPRAQVEAFHAGLVAKVRLQGLGRYRRLWLRKATLEFPKLVMRYVSWFFVRVLRVKTLFGARKELDRGQMSAFR